MPVKGDRLRRVSRIVTKLQRRLAVATENRSVQQVADEWGIPYWVLRDTLRGSTDCPRGKYIPAMARGLGITSDDLIDEAYAELEPVHVA
jgi:hypothetical protein